MDFRREIDKLLLNISETIVSGIKRNIKSGLFAKSPYGEPLDDSTIDSRRRRGVTSTVPLYDTGKFYNGLTSRRTATGTSIFSTGITEKAAAGAFFGKGHAPVRNPYNVKQPIADKSMEEYAVTSFADGVLDIAVKLLSKNGV